MPKLISHEINAKGESINEVVIDLVNKDGKMKPVDDILEEAGIKRKSRNCDCDCFQNVLDLQDEVTDLQEQMEECYSEEVVDEKVEEAVEEAKEEFDDKIAELMGEHEDEIEELKREAYDEAHGVQLETGLTIAELVEEHRGEAWNEIVADRVILEKYRKSLHEIADYTNEDDMESMCGEDIVPYLKKKDAEIERLKKTLARCSGSNLPKWTLTRDAPQTFAEAMTMIMECEKQLKLSRRECGNFAHMVAMLPNDMEDKWWDEKMEDWRWEEDGKSEEEEEPRIPWPPMS
jgi:hypothetical protein